MSISQIAGPGPNLPSLTGAGQPVADGLLPGPRALSPDCARQFRALCATGAEAAPAPGMPGASAAPAPGMPAASATPAADTSRPAATAGTPIGALDLDIERVVMSTLPPADATPAEFALGMLRAQVKVAQAAVGIELAAKTTQTLTQGVQTLTTRS